MLNVQHVGLKKKLGANFKLLEGQVKAWANSPKDSLEYQVYDKTLFGNFVYVNEGFLPHLAWRLHLPEDVIKSPFVVVGSANPDAGVCQLEFEPSVYYQFFASDKRSSTDLNFKFRKFSCSS